MTDLYRYFRESLRRNNDDKIKEIEQEMAELDWKIKGAEKELLASLYQLKYTEELINRLQTWIDMACRHAFDITKIREDLQAQLDSNDRLSVADAIRDNFESHERSQQIADFKERERFIQRTSDDVFNNEAKLRCVRAAMTVVDNERQLRAEYQDKLDDEVKELKQQVSEESGQLAKEVKLAIIVEQQVHLAEVLTLCQTIQNALLSEERRCVDEIASDRLAVGKMEEFNAKAIRNIEPERESDRLFVSGRKPLLGRCLTLLDNSVEEWREHLHTAQRQQDTVECHIEELRHHLSELQREKRNLMEKISQVRSERMKSRQELIKQHEGRLEHQVKKRIAMNQRLIRKWESERKHLEKEALEKTSSLVEHVVIN